MTHMAGVGVQVTPRPARASTPGRGSLPGGPDRLTPERSILPAPRTITELFSIITVGLPPPFFGSKTFHNFKRVNFHFQSSKFRWDNSCGK